MREMKEKIMQIAIGVALCAVSVGALWGFLILLDRLWKVWF